MIKKALLSGLLIASSISTLLLGNPVKTNASDLQVRSSQNYTFSWKEYWDSDSEDLSRTFSNFEGSGIDVSVNYSDNQAWQVVEDHFGLNLYERAYPPQLSSLNHYHDLYLYDGILRITNNTSSAKEQDRAFVELNFSEPVNLTDFWLGSLSLTHDNRVREWFRFTAYDAEGKIVAPSRVAAYEDFYSERCTQTQNQPGDVCNIAGADDPFYEEILNQADGSVLLKGRADAREGKYGRTFFAAEGVSRIKVEFFATQPNNDSQHSDWYTSAAISNTFSVTPANPDSDNGLAQAIPDVVAFRGDQAFPGYNVLSNDLNTDPNHQLTVAKVNGKKFRGRGFSQTLDSGSQITVNSNGELEYTPSSRVANRLHSEVTTEKFSYSLVGPDGQISSTEVSLQVAGYLYGD